MTDINTDAVLENGAVLTRGSSMVNLELEGDLGLFFMSQIGGRLDTDRTEFDTKQQRDGALLNTVNLHLAEGWTLAGES